MVGATPEQTHNHLVPGNDAARQEFFDCIICDEASQVDVAHSILPFCLIRMPRSVVLSIPRVAAVNGILLKLIRWQLWPCCCMAASATSSYMKETQRPVPR